MVPCRLCRQVFLTVRERGFAFEFGVARTARYYLETTKSGDGGRDCNAVKRWLQARTVGLPTAWARLLHFLFVRSTRSVVWVPPTFVQDPASASHRTPEHSAKNPTYPDPVYYLSFLGKYFFRNAEMRHMRIEQFNRYFALAEERAVTFSASVGFSYCTRPASGTIFTFAKILTKECERFGFPSCFFLLLVIPTCPEILRSVRS